MIIILIAIPITLALAESGQATSDTGPALTHSLSKISQHRHFCDLGGTLTDEAAGGGDS